MSHPVMPTTFASAMGEIERRLAALEAHSPQVTTVVDAAGQVRFINGKLDLLGGAYVGTYGAATLDASGNVISDSVGLRSMIAEIGSNPGSSGPLGPFPYSAIYARINASMTTWTVSRPVSVLVLGSVSFYITGGTASYGVPSPSRPGTVAAAPTQTQGTRP